MRNVLVNIIMSLFFGYILFNFEKVMDSDFIIGFLTNNMITILIALLAINSATLSIVLSKLKELIDKEGGNMAFVNTKKQMAISINEQIALICIASIFLILSSSKLPIFMNFKDYFEVCVISCFIYALTILNDTAKSAFILLDY